MKIKDLEPQLAAFLSAHTEHLPFGYEVETVEMFGASTEGKLRRRRCTADQPSERLNEVRIKLRPPTHPVGPRRASAPAPIGDDAEASEGQLADLMQALYTAAKLPGHTFIALKWFRDSYLPRQKFPWAAEAESRNRVLREATRRGWVRVDKIANPRNPGFDTSVLRVQSGLPEVRRLLGQPAALGWGFKRVLLPGEMLSETVRRMRDEGR